MTDEHDLRRPLDPFIAELADGANAGYRALEFVTQGLREGLRQQARTMSRAPQAASFRGGPAFGQPGFRRGPSLDPRPGGRGQLLDNTLGIIDGFLGVASNMTRALAELHTDPSEHATLPAGTPFQVDLEGPAGTRATGEFTLWNTGGSILSNVGFRATELLSATGRVDKSAISFRPAKIHVRPGSEAQVEVTVCIPEAAPPGRYHGCIQPTVAGTWAVVDLQVLPCAT